MDFMQYQRFVRKEARMHDKNRLVRSLAAGKSVLDLGAVAHTSERASVDGWLHGQLLEVAKEVVGVDILRKEVEALEQRGIRSIVVGDATALNLGRTFDLVVVGDLIEHVADLPGLLNSAVRHMHARSKLVVTTPNPFYVGQVRSILVSNVVNVNDEHVLWLDPLTAYRLFERFSLTVTDFAWLKLKQPAGSRTLQRWTLRGALGLVVSASLSPLLLGPRVRSYFAEGFALIAQCGAPA
jgi:2-polyprenyl-3-methyl-5-hydroxy-6-metoxy-1,4-benzoquinol methylase